jgi:hypothetical protein
VAFDGLEHGLEPAQHMGTDRLALEGPGKGHDLRVVGRDGEVVGPEMDHALDEGGGVARALAMRAPISC